MNHVTLAVGGLLLGALTVSGIRTVDAAYPDRPIRFIVPFAPGGPSDILSRMVGQKLSENMGQTLVIDNRGSVGGVLGFEVGAKSAPDGYTIVLAAFSGLTINPYVYKKLPYDPQRDFQPITQLTVGGNIVVVHPSVAAKSIKEFIALAKSRPGQLNYATTGTGNLLGIAHFKQLAGIDMVAIPYKGTGQAVIDLVAGHVQFFFMNPLPAIPQLKSGKLRGLAVTSTTRSSALPDLPTVAESGLSGYEVDAWFGLFAPARTPGAIVERLQREASRALRAPEVERRMQAEATEVVVNAPREFSAQVKAEFDKWRALVAKAGLKIQ